MMEAASQSTTDVVFTNIQDRYRRGDRIQFDLEWTGESDTYNWNEGDWIGLFKVGWKSEEDCLFREYINPENKRVNSFSLSIPKETANETTYQLCYMNHKNRLVAVSRSFTILPLDVDESESDYDWLDLFNVQGDVIVVSRQNNDETTPRSFEDLMAANMTLDSQLSCMKIEKETISTLLAENEHSKQTLENELAEARAEDEGKTARINKLELEIERMAINLSSCENQLATSLEKLSNVEEIKNQCSLAADKASTETAELKCTIIDLEEIVHNSAAEIATLKDMINRSNDDLQNANILNAELKEENYELKNTVTSSEFNDAVINASLICSLNILRQKDQDDYSDETEKLSCCTSLECAKRVEVEAKKCTDALIVKDNQNCDLEEIVRILQEESKSYQDEIERLSCNKHHREEEENSEVTNSLLALHIAHDHLQEAYNDAVKKGKHLYKQLSDMQGNLKSVTESNTTLKHQVTDLYTRLHMSKEAYKEKFIECCRLQNQLKSFKFDNTVDDQVSEGLLKKFSSRNEQLEKLLEKSEEDMNSVIQEIAKCHESLEEKQIEIDSLKAENRHLQQQQEGLNTEPYIWLSQNTGQ